MWDINRAGGVTQIHRYIDARHQQLGPIFREKLGHVEAVWLADPVYYQQVYQNEGVCPRLMLPEPWLIFNQKHAYKRGLFFMYRTTFFLLLDNLKCLFPSFFFKYVFQAR